MGRGSDAATPLTLGQSLLLFGGPSVVAAVAHYLVWPGLEGLGLSSEDAYYLATMIVFVGLLVATAVGLRLEGTPSNWDAVRQRLRLDRMGRRDWAWMLGGTVVYAVLALASTQLAMVVYDWLRFDPSGTAPAGPATNHGLYAVGLLLNTVSEELWWRGYILPRQELQHGAGTWLIHGTLWACFHGFKWYAVPFMLLTTWIVPFVAQRLKNTTPGLISHAVTNGLGLLLTLLGGGGE